MEIIWAGRKKIRVSGKKLGWEEKNGDEWKQFGVGGKNIFQFAFSRKDICVLSVQLSPDCLLYSLQWFIQLRKFNGAFYFERGLKYKGIQSELSSRYGFGTF